MRIFIITDRRFHGDWPLAIFSTLRILSSGISIRSAVLPASVHGPSLAASGEKYGWLVDGLNHMHRNTDGARLIRVERVIA